MVTKYGIELRKIRVVRRETLQDMADKVEFSISYLSSIENGIRKIPKNLTEKIIKVYEDLTEEEIRTLKAAELESKEGYNQGYNQGYKQGYNQGYNQGYKQGLGHALELLRKGE